MSSSGSTSAKGGVGEMKCRRCGMELPANGVHLFRGGEERRKRIEDVLHMPVTLCLNPPSEEYWNQDPLKEDV